MTIKKATVPLGAVAFWENSMLFTVLYNPPGHGLPAHNAQVHTQHADRRECEVDSKHVYDFGSKNCSCQQLRLNSVYRVERDWRSVQALLIIILTIAGFG